MSWKCSVPAPALLQRRGTEGLAQTAPGLGKSQMQTRFTFLTKLIGNSQGGHCLKNNNVPTFYSRNQIKTSAASSTSNYLTEQCVLLHPVTLKRWSKAELEECWGKWSAQAVLEIIVGMWSSSNSHRAIAWLCQWAGCCCTVCSSEDRSPAAARFEWTKAGP